MTDRQRGEANYRHLRLAPTKVEPRTALSNLKLKSNHPKAVVASKWLWEWGTLLLEMCSSISCGLVLLTYIMLLQLHFLITRSFPPLSFRHFPTCSFCFSAMTCLKPVLEFSTLLYCCWSTVLWFQAVGLSPCFVTKGCMWVRLCGLQMGCKWQYYFTFSFTWAMQSHILIGHKVEIRPWMPSYAAGMEVVFSDQERYGTFWESGLDFIYLLLGMYPIL